MERKQRRRFSREFKIDAVGSASQEGGPLAQVARDLGVGENLLRRWCQKYEADPTHALGSERVYRRRYRSRAEARADLFDDIEVGSTWVGSIPALGTFYSHGERMVLIMWRCNG